MADSSKSDKNQTDVKLEGFSEIMASTIAELGGGSDTELTALTHSLQNIHDPETLKRESSTNFSRGSASLQFNREGREIFTLEPSTNTSGGSEQSFQWGENQIPEELFSLNTEIDPTLLSYLAMHCHQSGMLQWGLAGSTFFLSQKLSAKELFVTSEKNGKAHPFLIQISDQNTLQVETSATLSILDSSTGASFPVTISEIHSLQKNEDGNITHTLLSLRVSSEHAEANKIFDALKSESSGQGQIQDQIKERASSRVKSFFNFLRKLFPKTRQRVSPGEYQKFENAPEHSPQHAFDENDGKRSPFDESAVEKRLSFTTPTPTPTSTPSREASPPLPERVEPEAAASATDIEERSVENTKVNGNQTRPKV